MNDHTLSPVKSESPTDTIAVPLGHGKYALIDTADARLVVQYRWSCVKTDNKSYAVSWLSENRKTVAILLHVLLMQPPEGMEVDHINSDSLDCRRVNMRVVTHSQNMQNVVKQSRSPWPYKGIFQVSNRWYGHIRHQGKRISLGGHDTAEDAARAYDAKARELFGEFSRLNFPEEVAS